MNVLVSGAGIAGSTVAFWLQRYGIRPTLSEKAPALRTGGYVIDFWGAGFEIADRMGVLPQIRTAGYGIREVRAVGADGRRVAGFPVEVFARATNGRYVSLRRGDLAEVLFVSLREVETIFGDAITSIEQDHQRAGVTFESGRVRAFDLVIGADGLHPRVRELIQGPLLPVVACQSNLAVRAFALPLVAKPLIARSLRDDLELPECRAA
jgi:2-polyprenyl-6-methoxyphenol hydroxylase-like FAD-dependent oxidoreductase